MPDGSLRRCDRLRLVESTSRWSDGVADDLGRYEAGGGGEVQHGDLGSHGGVLVQDEDVLADEPHVLEAGSRAPGVSGLDQLPVQVQRGAGVRLLGGHVDSVSVGSDG